MSTPTWALPPSGGTSSGDQFWIFSPPTSGGSLAIWIAEFVIEHLPIWQSLWSRITINYAMNNQPSPAIFNGQVYCFYPSAPDLQYIYYATFDGTSWSEQQVVPDAYESTAPGVAVFNSRLYVFYQSFSVTAAGLEANGELYYNYYDGSSWSAQSYPAGSGSIMSGCPAAVAFNGSLYVFYQGSGNNGQLWYSQSSDGSDWSFRSQIANANITTSPAAAVFTNPSDNQSNLYVFHQNGTSGQLWYSVLDTAGNWSSDAQIANVSMSATPCAAAYNGRLYVLYEGGGNNGQFWYISSADGSTWGTPSQVASIGLTAAPSLVVLGTQLCCMMQNPGYGGELWYASINQGGNWGWMTKVNNEIMSQSPGTIVFNNKIYCFLQGQGNNGALYCAVFDGTDWQPSFNILSGGGMSNSPAPVSFNSKLWVFYQGGGLSGQINYSQSTDGSSWSAKAQVPDAGMSASPTAVVFDQQLYVFYIGKGNASSIWYSVLDANGNWGSSTQVNSISYADPYAAPSAVLFDGKLYLFYIGTNYAINYTTLSNGQWSSPVTLNNSSSGYGTECIGTVVYDNGSGAQLYCFFQGSASGIIYFMSASDPSSAGNWSAISQMGGSPSSGGSSGAIAELANLTIAGFMGP